MFTPIHFKYRLTPNPDDIFRRALGAHQTGDLPLARSLYAEVLRYRPEHLDALHFLGVAEGALGNSQLALQYIQQAIKLSPTNAACHLNLGNIYKDVAQLELAIASYLRAIELRPTYHMAYCNLGAIQEQLGEFDKAIESYDHALTLAPGYPDATWNRGALALLLGDYATGWVLCESRWGVKAHQMAQKEVSGIRWTGQEPIADKQILIFAEQGLGDSIQFCRYGLMLQQLGAKVVLQVPRTLKKLLQTLSNTINVIGYDEQPPECDYYCPMGSLPMAFGTTLETIPSYRAYLHAPLENNQPWGERIPDDTKPHIGLVWRGNPEHFNDRNRSINLKTLLSVLPQNCNYVCLQVEVNRDDQEALSAHPNIFKGSKSFQDFADTAAVCANLDGVVTVDTSVAHLAGALGIPTLVLIPFVPDWRWLLGRDDSPWYPTVRLYRQKVRGDWSGALVKLAEELKSIHPGDRPESKH